MRGTSESPGQMAMIAYPRVISVWYKRLFAHVRSTVKFFPLVSYEPCYGYINGQDNLYIMC